MSTLVTPIAGEAGRMLALSTVATTEAYQPPSGTASSSSVPSPSTSTTPYLGSSISTSSPSTGGKRTKQEIANDLRVFLKWYLNFGVYRLNKGKFKNGALQLDYLHGRVGVGRKGQVNLHIPFEVLEKVTLSETDPRCFHLHLHDLTPVVLYSQQDDDRDKIVGELRQIINNTEYLKGSTEPPKLNDYAEIIRLGEIEKKGPVKRVNRTLMLTDTQLLCLRDTTRDAFPVNVIEICDILAVEREKDATFKVITEHRTFQFKAPSMPKREKWVIKLTAAIEIQSEMRERALEENNKKQRKQKHSEHSASEIMLPSGIPLLGRYEVKFTDLHALFGQSIQKPDKVINLKTYYDIKYAAIRNQLRKQISLVTEATGVLSLELSGETALTQTTLLQSDGADSDEDGVGGGDDTAPLSRKQRKQIKKRAKLARSGSDVMSISGDSKRRFLGKKKSKSALKQLSQSDILHSPATGRNIVSAREVRETDDARSSSDKQTWSGERNVSSRALPRYDPDMSSTARLLSGHRSCGSAVVPPVSASLPHPPSPLSAGGRAQSPRAGSPPPRPPRSTSPPPTTTSPSTSTSSSSTPPTSPREWATVKRPGNPTPFLAASVPSQKSSSGPAVAGPTPAAAAARFSIVGGYRQNPNGHDATIKLIDEEDEDDSSVEEEVEADEDDSEDDDDEVSNGDREEHRESGISSSEDEGVRSDSAEPSPSSWRRGSMQRSLDIMGGSTVERGSMMKNLGVKDMFVLQTGSVFTKYCRNAKGAKNLKGARRQRLVCLSPDFTSILVFRNPDRSIKGKKDCRTIALSHVVDICKGFKTPILTRHGRPGEEVLAFSIYYTKPHSGDRTLDLVAESTHVRDTWVLCLQQLLASRRVRS